jgi:hypothetical protein
MPDLPAPVYAYVHAHLLATRAPAYLLVQKDGRLEAWGGDLARYGLVGLQQGIEVESQVHVLAGLLSRKDVPLCLPCIETPSGRFVDLHLFSTAAGMGVLFLDATGEELQRRLLQQKANEMVLLQEYYTALLGRRQGQDMAHDPIRHLREALMTASLFAQMFAALDMVVMERTAEGAFRLLSTVPEWFARLYPEAALQQDGLQPGHIFPGLEAFLIDADELWRVQDTGQLKSGPWRAIDSTGQDYALEASAMCLGKHQILCLALPHIPGKGELAPSRLNTGVVRSAVHLGQQAVRGSGCASRGQHRTDVRDVQL